MMRIFRFAVVFALIAAFALSPFSSRLLAAEDGSTAPASSTRTISGPPLLNLGATRDASAARADASVEPSFATMASSDVEAQRRGYRGAPYGGRRAAAARALFIGAAAAITGAAVLAYANRPECDDRPYASMCGYGTKVIGTSVLAGGVVGVMVGAALWH